jgi:hypothetical protein
VLAAIEAWPLAGLIRTSTWGYPALEVLHIAALASLFGALLLLDLRLWGRAPRLPLAALAGLAVPVALSGFALAAATGALMLMARATEIATHPAFLVKLGLIGMAGANAWWFHRRRSAQRHDRLARLQGFLSLGLWFGAIAAGRWIAYV